MKKFSKQGSLKTLNSISTKSFSSKVEESKVQNIGPKSLEKYYSDLDKVQAKIDNKPPKFNIDAYYNPRNLEAYAQTVMEIDKQNFELLKRLNTIHRMGGKVDCWNLELKFKAPINEQQSDNDRIMKENRDLLTKIENATGLYCTADLLREWRESRAATKKSSKNPLSNKSTSALQLTKNKLYPSVNVISTSKIEDYTRPRCYFEIEIDNEHRKLGKLIFQLFADIVPKTCENFLSFCRGVNGLSYKGTPFHRILLGYLCQGGDVTKFNGSGGTSIYGDYFEDENFEIIHSEPGILSTCSYGENSNNSKFNLTFKKLETLDGKKVVFGKIISGLSTLRVLEGFGTNNGRPTSRIVVSKCGVL